MNIMEERVERRLAAILSADVKGYSRLMGDDEVATIRMLTTYREVITTLITQHRGRGWIRLATTFLPNLLAWSMPCKGPLKFNAN